MALIRRNVAPQRMATRSLSVLYRVSSPIILRSGWAFAVLPWVRRRGVAMEDEGRKGGANLACPLSPAVLATGLTHRPRFLPMRADPMSGKGSKEEI